MHRSSPLLLGLIFGLCSGLFAQEPNPLPPQTGTPPKFIRFHKTESAKATLDTGLSRYRHPKTGQQLTLVGAVHVADSSYFEAIQRELDSHDLVLYEMVGAPGEERDEALVARLSIIGELQNELAELLALGHQRHGIDYGRRNLRHADMSLAEFNKALKERGDQLIPGEGLMRLLAPLMKLSFGMTRAIQGVDPHLVNRTRWQAAQSLADVDGLLKRFGLNKNNDSNPDDLIIGVRNDYAWKIFQESLPAKFQRTALFYGAAHLPDFHRRLIESGWQLEGAEWMPAWYIPAPKAVTNTSPQAPPEAGRKTSPAPREAKL